MFKDRAGAAPAHVTNLALQDQAISVKSGNIKNVVQCQKIGKNKLTEISSTWTSEYKHESPQRDRPPKR